MYVTIQLMTTFKGHRVMVVIETHDTPMVPVVTAGIS